MSRPFNNYLRFDYKNGHNFGSSNHFLMKISGYLNGGQKMMPVKFQVIGADLKILSVMHIFGESDNSPKFSGGSHDTQSGTGLIDWVLD